MPPAWLVEFVSWRARTLYVYAGVGICIRVDLRKSVLWEEGNISIDGQLPRCINPLMDVYYLTSRSSVQQVTGIATCKGDGELIYKVHTAHQMRK